MIEIFHFIIEQTMTITYVDNMLTCQLLGDQKGLFFKRM